MTMLEIDESGRYRQMAVIAGGGGGGRNLICHPYILGVLTSSQ